MKTARPCLISLSCANKLDAHLYGGVEASGVRTGTVTNDCCFICLGNFSPALPMRVFSWIMKRPGDHSLLDLPPAKLAVGWLEHFQSMR